MYLFVCRRGLNGMNDKDKLEEMILDIKDAISEANDFAVENNVFKDDPTKILNLSCGCDEILGAIEDAKREGKNDGL